MMVMVLLLIQLLIAILCSLLMNTGTLWSAEVHVEMANCYPLFFAYEHRYMMVMVYLMVQLFIGIIIENVEVRKDGREETAGQVVL